MKKLLFLVALCYSLSGWAGWDVNNSNAYEFDYQQNRYALAIVLNAEGDGNYWFMIAKLEGSDWLLKVILERDLTSEMILSHGSIYNFLMDRMPDITRELRDYLLPVKPTDPNDKPANAGYDLSFPGCMTFDPLTIDLEQTCSPPLPHAR